MKKYLIVRVEVPSWMFDEGGRKFYIVPWPECAASLARAMKKITRLAHKWGRGVPGYKREDLEIEKYAECELVEPD